MTEQHPITPPPDLLQEWYDNNKTDYFTDMICAAQWGADQELEACCEWLIEHGYDIASPELRAARRPKPPSLKEEALDALEEIGQVGSALVRSRSDTIRKALEQLDD